jgi:hypothetical protein
MLIPRRSAFSTRVDLCRGSEKAKPVPNLHYLFIADFAIGAPWHYLEEVTIRTDGGRWHMPELQSSHALHIHGVVSTIDLDFEVMPVILVILASLGPVLQVLITAFFIRHGILRVVCWYHATKQL